MKKPILITGSLITILLASFWYFNIITEPIFTIGASILTFLGYIFIPDKENSKNITTIKQKHTGTGDNVAGDKIIKG